MLTENENWCARIKLGLLENNIRREMFCEKILNFDPANKKLQWFMHPSLSKCWARCNIFMLHVNIWFGLCSIVCLLMKMIHLAQNFGMNHCNFLLPASNFKIFSQNILRLMLFSSKPNFRRAHQFSFSINKIKETDPSLVCFVFYLIWFWY